MEYRNITVNDLEDGMVIARDVISDKGVPLIMKGKTIESKDRVKKSLMSYGVKIVRVSRIHRSSCRR